MSLWQHYWWPWGRTWTSPRTGQAPAVSPPCPRPTKEQPPSTAGQVSRWGTCPCGKESACTNTHHFLLVLLLALGSAGVLALLVMVSSLSSVVRTLYLFCSCRPTDGAGVVLLVQEVATPQPSPLKDSPFPCLIITEPACSSFWTAEWFSCCLEVTQLELFLIGSDTVQPADLLLQ